MRVPNVMEVSPTLPVKTVPEFIAYAKANPGKVMFASSGVGTTIHMSGELFKAMAGVDMLHVPYRGHSWPAQARHGLVPRSSSVRIQQIHLTSETSPSRQVSWCRAPGAEYHI